MKWGGEKIWSGEVAYVIGGGPSLKDFDWEMLRGKRTIGCNSAYKLGSDLCEVLFFGDVLWFERNKDDVLRNYKGRIFSSLPNIVASNHPRLWGLPRKKLGAGEQEIGWNGNSGFSAVNLAAIFGARKIYLLGFDMALGPNGENNYHNDTVFPVRGEVYDRFRGNEPIFAREMAALFPETVLINLNPDSKLTAWRKLPREAGFVETGGDIWDEPGKDAEDEAGHTGDEFEEFFEEAELTEA